VPEDGISVRLDPLNPGQFFACCGLFELLSLEKSNLLAHFALDRKMPRVASFRIPAESHPTILGTLLQRLRNAPVTFPDENCNPPVRPALIAYQGAATLELDWWLDEFRDETTNLKCWAGQVTTRRLFTELLPLLDSQSTYYDLFERSAHTTSLFGVDPRSAWNTLDLGFSPNEHGIPSTVFPAVEILAAIGLQYFRPGSANRSEVRYSLWAEPLPASVARLAFSSPWDGLARADMSFEICKRGQSYKFFSFARYR
jgi:CRISPR-associated protein Csb3